MMESKANMGSEVHVIVFPYPIQGHINPMLQFSKQLASRGLNVTLATTSSFSSKFHDLKSSSITIETISDGSTEAATPGTVEEYMKKFDVVAPKSLTQLVEHKIGIGHNVRCLVYDSGIPWALDIAKKFDIQGASFFTQSCLVSLIFYQVHQGILSIPVEGPEICVPGMTFDARDVPSFVRRVGLHPSLEKLVINQFSNCGDANWRFFNTFDGLESKGEVYQKPIKGAHVLVLSYPLLGHINPMLQFSKRLASKGLKVTVITTTSISNRLCPQTTGDSSCNIEFVRVYDGYEEEPDKVDVEAYLNRLRVSISLSLFKLLDYYKQNSINFYPTPKMVIYDAFMPWVLQVVKKSGLEGAPFFTQSCVVNSIYYHAYKGDLITSLSGSDLVSLPSIGSLLRVDDLPSFVSTPSLYANALVKVLLDQFSNLEEVNCLFVNTMDVLEIKVVDWMASQWAVKTIGPCIPSMYLDKRLEDDKDYGLSLFKAQTDACIQWLDARESASVVYISMGSLASLGGEQMVEIAKGLEKSNKFFLWVVRALEESKLPLNFKEKTSNKGLIVNWCPQLEVLAHSALGCFVTHCGWNSTLEAVSLGVPMVAFPQWTDQPTNAKCIVDFWRTGVRVKVDDQGFLNSDELEFSIREVMEGERAKEIRSNATKWKQLTKEAMEEGGSSDRNIEEFIAKLLSYS
uniref:Glycosyltransferase N-terminal domain-containing protein n=1 Tax=Chenopodium quinoa TaxID=63459 RepID=A0A803M5M8_CHEQI